MKLPTPSQAALLAWIERYQDDPNALWRSGHQGKLLRYTADGFDVVLKCPRGRGWRGWWSRRCLQREYRAYQRLQGVGGIPQCHGLLAGRYLVLQYVPAESLRDARIDDRARWFAALFKVLQAMHHAGVAHGDLKRKSNLLVTAQQQPLLIDFGTAWICRRGFHPFNRWLFAFLARTDLNAYVKHKYCGRYQDVTLEDAHLLRYSWLEGLISRWRKWRERRRERG